MRHHLSAVLAFVIFIALTLVESRAEDSSLLDFSLLDFGDAPDGKFTGYTGAGVAVLGSFPSLLASNGARTLRTDEVWLGVKADKESNAKLVNADNFDDGVEVSLKSCQESSANIVVHVATPGTSSGKAFLNLFFDWNKDGKWEGSDACGPEWAVRNFPIDLSLQNTDMDVYVPSFTAGKLVDNIWYRAVLTLNERMVSENGTGQFSSGEVEDYGPPVISKRAGAVCKPRNRVIEHGKSGKFQIVKVTGSEPITGIRLVPGPVNNKAKNISLAGNTVTYKSKQKDPPKRFIPDQIKTRVYFGDKATSLNVRCYVVVAHTNLIKRRPPQQDFTLIGSTGGYRATLGTKVTGLVGNITPSNELGAMGVNGFELALDEQIPSLASLSSPQLCVGINGTGQPSDWSCTLSGSTLKCNGTTTTLQTGVESTMTATFQSGITQNDLPKALHVHLMKNAEPVGSVEWNLLGFFQ